MDWKRAKIILIVLFAAINVFLISNLFFDHSKQRSVTPETIEQTRVLLEKNGVTLKDSVTISEKIYAMKLLSMELDDPEEESFFNMEESAPRWEDFAFTEEAVLEKAKAYAEEQGLVSQKNGEWRVVIPTEGRAVALYYPMHRRYCLFNGGLMLTFTKNGGVWVSVKGTGLQPGSMVGGSVPVWHATAVLAEFIAEPSLEGAPMTMKSLTLGYYVGANYDREAVPAWEIVTEKAVYYYDATTGRFLGKIS